jgi:hypothetical protein
VVTVSRIREGDETIRLADPVGERRGSGRVFSRRVFDEDAWRDDHGVLEVSVIRGGNSANFLWSNRGTRVLSLGTLFTTLSREGVSMAGLSRTTTDGLRLVALRMRFTISEVVEGFVRDGADLRWSKAGLCWSILLVDSLLVYPFGADVVVDVIIMLEL